jgi:purine-binding chemotaxis protein CheW
VTTEWPPGAGEGVGMTKEKRRILEERARLLARRPREDGEGDGIAVVTFTLGGERFGIESSCIREIRPLASCTPIPCTPPFVLGAVHIRRRIVPVIDLGKLLDLQGGASRGPAQVIVLHDGGMEFGVLAEGDVASVSIRYTDLQPPLPILRGIRGEFLKGVMPGPMVILDGKKLLTFGMIVVHETVPSC